MSEPTGLRGLRGEGILVGRPQVGSEAYDFVVLPKRLDLDALSTSPPPSITRQQYKINTSVVDRFLRGLYLVTYTLQVYPTNNGVMHRALIDDSKNYEPTIIDIDNPVESVKSIDDRVEYDEFKGAPRIDGQFIYKLSKLVGTLSVMPKRFYATQVAMRVKDDEGVHPILVPFQESYLFLQENPSLVRGILVLHSYKLIILIGSEITFEDLRDEISARASLSRTAFNNDFKKAIIVTATSEEE